MIPLALRLENLVQWIWELIYRILVQSTPCLYHYSVSWEFLCHFCYYPSRSSDRLQATTDPNLILYFSCKDFHSPMRFSSEAPPEDPYSSMTKIMRSNLTEDQDGHYERSSPLRHHSTSYEITIGGIQLWTGATRNRRIQGFWVACMDTW
ncbi:hypothetical protein KSP40_PGU001553 [Platanthera guangdongensis]|uniref:Uncharacterized protein n=1 Tax=Platanthera guangdongensis TaxID=2320717 RepID=A0ABR2LQL9_9ASPA